MEPVHKKRKQEASKPLSDEEDIGYRTMTREDAAIMQHQQQLTSRQQITQPHGGGKGGVVDPPGSVGILLPQTSTAQSLPSGAGHGGIGVVPNAALMNRYICSEQAIIGASAPGMVFDDGQKKWIPSSSSSGLSKLQIIHTQQNKTFRVVGRNLQHQQQILQPPCGGGVRPPGSVVILSPQTPTAQGLPPGGGIGVVPNAPQMNRSICSEQSIIGACASVMVYDDDQKKWIPSGSSSGLSKVQIIHHQQNNTFRVVGRKLQDHEVVINCSITKGLIYNEATATFHQWRDSKVMYGLSFSSQQDAEAFAQAMMHALEVLSGRVLPSSMQTNPNHNPLAYEEDMDYGTMKTRDDAAIMQHQQKPTSRQQITQPHGNGEGGGVDPPCSVGILLPQIPTSQGLPLGGGIGVVPNAALMNRSICSEQVIIGASAPGMVYDDGQKKWIPSSSSSGLGKLQIIHTQQNKTIRVVARNLQHQQQILQPPCGGGVRPPSSVVILSPQTPTAQGLPPGGGIGVVPNAPQMNRSICSEQSIIGACASVMVYDDGQKKWIPSGSSSGLSKVQIIHHQQNNTFRVVGRKLQDHEIVLNCSIIKGLKYNQATASFHQWRDSKVMYGLSFSSEQDAEAFARAMMHALEVLSGRVPPSSMQTNPNRNSLAYEEDMDYGTMKTRKDEAIMQHHQRLTSRQQITQPHGGGEGGVVGPPDLVGILLPQIPTSKGLPPGAGQGGISVVSNAAQMNQGPPPLQQQQHLTNKQQIPQPHGGGGGGRVDPGIQMPQTSTSQDPTPGGGIGVVPNAALINRSICSEQAIIGARAPGMVYDDGQKKWIPSSSSSGLGKLQIIHTQQNKTIRVVARNLQHQQQILQPPCGGGVRPPSSVVILSPQTPTAQGLPPGGGIGVVPNAPQMNRSICSEQSIIGACASVMVYDDDQKKWIPSGSSSGLSKVQIIHHQQNNTFRVVGRKLQDHEVVINCSITKGLIYNEATATFHQWRDSKVMYGLSFSSQQDAEAFARAMMHALEVLSGRVPPSSMQTNPSHNPLAYEEDMDYSTMKTREDVAILQYQQELTSRQQITQPHGGGEGGGVRRPGSVGILLPQIPTSHGLPLVGGIGVVPNAALMNRSICSEQAIIGASAPGMVYDDGQKKWIPSSSSSGLSKLQIIHTQQNKTLRVVGRNLQHQQQILQPPCGGGVRPPGSVVILSPQTPTAQGLPPGGGIGVVPNAPQMNRSICSEQSIIGACASVMVYDDDQKKWIPSGSSSGLSKVQIIHHQQNNTFRVVGRKLQDHEVVINCSITKGLKYNEATATFHQWRDSKVMYGLSFSSQQDAEAFARAMMRALEVLSGRVPLSSMQTNQNLLAFDEDRTYSTIKTRPQEITLPHGDDGGDGVGPPSSVGILLPQIPGLPHGVEQGGISVVSNAAQINQEPPPLQLQLQQQAHRTIRKGSDTMTVNEHYHPDHSLKIAKAELQEALRKECVETFADYREVFDKVCNLPEHREAASHLTYSNVLSAMRNARHQCFPRLPKSASDFHKLMLTEKAAGFQTIRNEQFYHGCVGGEGDLTLFFVVPSTVDVLRRTESTKLLFDGTFKTKPTIFAQLFMAYAQISGKVFPLAFMPMEVASPKSTTYVTILNKLISLIPPVEVVGTITDFEKSLINACRMVFPNATHQGCLFHFKQALRRCIISKIGISPTSTEYAEYRIAMQLPHLPADKIAAGVEVAMKHIRERTSDEKAAGLFQTYLKAQWLKNVNPQIYSTYRIQTTTNNAAESFHSLMGRKIGVSPSAWIFVEKIIAMAKTTALEIARVQHIQQRREQSDRQRYVAKCTDIFDVDGDIYKFLLALCSKSTEFGYLPLVENDAVEALEDCIICMKPAAISLQPCMHKPFCGVCVWQALNTNPTCPICKEAWVGLIKDSEKIPPCVRLRRPAISQTNARRNFLRMTERKK